MSVLLKFSGLVLQFEPEFLEQFPDRVVKVCVNVSLDSGESEALVPWRLVLPFDTEGTTPAVFEAKVECTGDGDVDAGRCSLVSWLVGFRLVGD